jgi:hypothetical protein
VITALKSQALLNESVGAGYIERNWPPAFKESGAWPLSSLRQSFLNGSLTRLLDPDSVLKSRIVEFVRKGDFGLASGPTPGGGYGRVLFEEEVDPADIMFDSGVFLLLKSKAVGLKSKGEIPPGPELEPRPGPEPRPETGHEPKPGPGPEPGAATRILRISGNVPPEIWNRLGTKILPKLRSGTDLKIGVEFSVTVDAIAAPSLEADLKQLLQDLGLRDKIRIL